MLHFLKKYKKKILRVSLGLSAFFAICMFMVSHSLQLMEMVITI